MEKLHKIASKTVVLPNKDIDTDQIIPAKYLTTTTREGLGDAIFASWRYDEKGDRIPDFPLHHPDAADSKVLVAGHNFGCGSSREHAPWGLVDFGFRAVISTQIADIFRNNALKNGLVPVVVDEDIHSWLLENPGADVIINVEETWLELPDGRRVGFELDSFARHCLLHGVDQLGYLLEHDKQISEFEQNRSWKP
jgi:3-isopropylmalate/(R)-2-methylmalate dehydratase small subunit